MLDRRVLLLRVAEAVRRRREDHHRRHAPRHLGRVVQRPARQLTIGPGHLAAGVGRGRDQRRVERDRIDPPQVLERDRAALGARRRSRPPRASRASISASAPASRWRWSTSKRRPARNGGDDAGLAARVADRADAAVTTCDLAQLEREARRGQERVAAAVDRRRARVGGLAVEDRAGAARPRRCRAPCRPRAPRTRAPAPARCAARGRPARARAATPPRARDRARHRARAPRPRGACRRSRPDPAPRRDRACPPQPSCRTGCDRSAHPPRPPSRRVRPSRAAGRSPPPRAAPRAPPSRRARRRASRRSAPSRRASRRRRVSGRSPSSTAQTLPASSTSTRTGSSARRLAHELARTHPLVGPAQAPRAVRAAGQLGEPAQVGDHARRVESRRAHVGVALPRSCGMISRP